MKKLLTILSIAAATIISGYAQYENNSSNKTTSPVRIVQGQIYLGGSLSFKSGSEKDANGDKTSSSSSFGIIPRGGYMIKDNIGIHALIGFRSGSEDDSPDNDTTEKRGKNTFELGLGRNTSFLYQKNFTSTHH